MRMTDNMLIDAVLDDLQVQGVQLAGWLNNVIGHRC